MARGDVVADVVSLSDNTNHDIQPGSGVEWIIKSLSLGDNVNCLLRGYDGTNVAAGWDGVQSGNVAGVCTIPINNTNYVQMRNSTGSTTPLAYFGIITKE